QQTTYDIAAEAMVLLKNKNNLLPLDKSKIKKLLVVGRNAAVKHSEGGSSSGVRTVYEVTPLEGIKNKFSDTCEIEYESGVFDLKYNTIPMQNLNITDLKAGCRNYKIVTNTQDENGNTVSSEALSDSADIKGTDAVSYDIYFSVAIPESGGFSFRAATNGSAVVKINGETKIEINEVGMDLEGSVSYDFKKGDNLDFEIHVSKSKVHKETYFNFGWITPSEYASCSSEKLLLQKAKEADCVIYCGGLDHSYDTESIDKRSMRLTNEQDVIIPKLLKANQNTVIVITAGSPVEMPWIDDANAVLWTWYAGMEGGNALADILTGKICPSGKMPFTLPYKYEDTPVARYGEYRKENCKYNEDILVGYRAFDNDGIAPMFPFGHGLSYSEFEYSDLKLSAENDTVTVEYTIKNIGNCKAKETTQVYVGDPVCSVKRPPKELRSFMKVELKSGEAVRVSLTLNSKDLSFYDEASADWKLEKGEFIIYVGSSSGDIRLSGSIDI
ncbi:MAG: glycoside hydrolase family 3 C-terminal domain-containing protein, partial [Acutalibacteraceae bacterium]|nr:glycoside hydrolase family 3 C-terminal domain-containing protein [Acutalibacteraceae bacterium]